jgi:hypothetical protein
MGKESSGIMADQQPPQSGVPAHYQRQRYTRRPLGSPEELLAYTRTVLASGRSILVMTDFDSTVTSERGDRDNPFAASFDAQAGQALVSLQQHGQGVGIISNRAVRQIVRRCEQIGFDTLPLVAGTYGYEVRALSGESIIDRHFAPYREVITDVLFSMRQGLLSTYGLAAADYREVETTIPTPSGPVYLEIKGQCAAYPEGLAQEYNFNRMPPAERTSTVTQVERLVQLALSRHPRGQVESLLQVWGIVASGSPAASGHFSWALRPLLPRGKAYAFVRLLALAKSSEAGGGSCGLIMYIGNHKQEDGPAMWAGKVLERHAQGQMRFVGVWAREAADTDMPEVEDESDVRVEGVRGVAGVLMGLAAAVGEYRQG